jgi:HlyD family secretion protein
VEADVNESNIGKIEPGQPAEVKLIAVPEKRYAGRLRQVVPTADRQKAIIQAKVTILDPDEKVFPEMSAQVLFLKSAPQSTEPPRVVAPFKSIVEREGQRVAFVVEDERVRRVQVEAGPVKDGQVMIQSGLRGGETVVLSPPPGLSDGSRVRIQK